MRIRRARCPVTHEEEDADGPALSPAFLGRRRRPRAGPGPDPRRTGCPRALPPGGHRARGSCRGPVAGVPRRRRCAPGHRPARHRPGTRADPDAVRPGPVRDARTPGRPGPHGPAHPGRHAHPAGDDRPTGVPRPRPGSVPHATAGDTGGRRRLPGHLRHRLARHVHPPGLAPGPGGPGAGSDHLPPRRADAAAPPGPLRGRGLPAARPGGARLRVAHPPGPRRVPRVVDGTSRPGPLARPTHLRPGPGRPGRRRRGRAGRPSRGHTRGPSRPAA